MMSNPPSLMSTDELASRLGAPDLVIIDASWYLPSSGRDAFAEHVAGHIPGALFFDIDAICDRDAFLPHMLPTAAAFAEMAGTLGINERQTIVVYDDAGFHSAPRAWWMLTTMGAQDVRILSGGGQRWRQEGRRRETGVTRPPRAKFVTSYRPENVADFDTVLEHSQFGTAQIVDARPAARFCGQEPEPRPGLRRGRIPGSLNVPASALHEAGQPKPADALATLFHVSGIDLTQPVLTTCGSGIAACALAFCLHLAGARSVSVYDASWSEWGARPEAEIER